jgi:CHAT domain-containing protein
MFALNEFKRMSPSERYLYWQDNHHFLDYEYPLYVSNNINDDNISELFNVVLYKKGITKKSEKNEEITWEDIKYHLKDDEIAIEFIAIPDLKFNSIDIYALYIRKEYVSPKMKKIFCLNEIEKINNSTKDLHNRNIKLGELIWKFLSSEENEIKNVYFSPTHCLHTLAIENLPINDLEYYCDKFNMYRLSSTGSLLATKKKCVLKNAVLFGGLFYDITPLKEQTKYSERAGFEPLYNTYDEVMDIATILNNNNILSSIYSKYDGTESCFKNLSNKPINILHLATHGMNVESADVSSLRDNNNLLFLRPDISNRPHYIENALTRSFIVLSNGNSLNNRSITEYAENDGIINALEISKLHFDQLDLVVLSACETAQGEFGYDDSVLGLQYSFKLAGTNTILMSLDKVDDEATKILMVEFYKNLMSGKTKQQSLKDAQKYLRSVENRKYDDPKYWASFIMLDGLN